MPHDPSHDPTTQSDSSPVSTPAATSAADDSTSVAQPFITPTAQQIGAASKALLAELEKLPDRARRDLALIAEEYAPSIAEWSLNGGSDEAMEELHALIVGKVGIRAVESQAQLEQFLRDALFVAGKAALRG